MSIRRVTVDSVLMDMAKLWAKRSTCSRARVGAVVSIDGRVVTTGYNGAPAGMQHCNHDPKVDSPCTTAVHAEANCIAFAARHGVALNAATMHTTMMPCVPCAQLIVNAGIVRVVAWRPYRLSDGENLLREAGIVVKLTAVSRIADRNTTI